MVDQLHFLVEGATLGLATGHICLATCGPVYAPFLMQKERPLQKQILTVVEMSGGRFVTYLIIGALAGIFGKHVSELQRDYFSVAAYLLFSVYLIISALRSNKCESGCATGRWNRFAEWPFLLGMLTGINFCPSFMLALTRSFTLSGPVAGMLFFSAFFVGTSVFLVPLSFIGLLGYKRHFRTIARFAAVGVAAWFIGHAGVTGFNLIKPHFDKRPVITLLDKEPLYIVISDPERARQFAASIAPHRTGPVFVADTIKSAYQRYYVMTEAKRLSDTVSGAPFRKSGVFVAVIADKYIENPDSTSRVIDFLSNYHFRFNTEKGDIFYLR